MIFEKIKKEEEAIYFVNEMYIETILMCSTFFLKHEFPSYSVKTDS